MLYSQPFHLLYGNDERRRVDLRHYDALTLALRTLDLIVEDMGLENEADRESVQAALKPLLHGMDRAANVAHDPAKHVAIVEIVLGLLRNVADRGRPFNVPYTVFDANGQAVTRQLSFHLLVERFNGRERPVYHLSNQALNLYLRALDHDIESEQAAQEAMVENQMARGKYTQAARSAKNARLQSVRYQEKIEKVLRETKRDLERVDWDHDVPQTLDDALVHIRSRQDVERTVLNTATDRLQALPEEDDRATSIAHVIQEMQDCQRRHAQLHNVLLNARDTFLHEQDRQRFAPKPVVFQPDLVEQTLHPLLRMPTTTAADLLAECIPAFIGARVEPLFSLAQLIKWQLKPPIEYTRGLVLIDGPNLVPVPDELANYSPDARAQAHRVLAAIKTPTRLTELLRSLRLENQRDDVCEVVALLVLRNFAPEGTEGLSIQSETVVRHRLNDPLLYGDEMVITPGGL